MTMRAFLAVLALTVTGCAGVASEKRKFEQTLYHYAAAVRWGDIEQILAFHEPTVLVASPPEEMELDRWRQLRVAGYRTRGQEPQPDGSIVQFAQIEFTNRHTQTSFVVVDREIWRFDKDAKRWWLESGLPDLDQRQN